MKPKIFQKRMLTILSCLFIFSISNTATSQSSSESTIDRIVDRCKVGSECRLIVGVKQDAPPLGYWDEMTQELKGFEIDLAKAFAECWLGNKEFVNFVVVTSSNRFGKIASREIDLLIATTTRRNDSRASFSDVYFRSDQRLLINVEADLGKKIQENTPFSEFVQYLDGKTGAVIDGATSHANLEEKIKEYNTVHNTNVGVTFEPFLTYDAAVDALDNQEVDFVTTDGGILFGHQARYPKTLKVVGEEFFPEPYGIGVYYGDVKTLDKVNMTLQVLKKSGRYDEIYRQWFCTEPDKPCAPYDIEYRSGTPDFSDLPGSCNLEIQPSPTPVPSPTPTHTPPVPRFHVVKKGETLSTIAPIYQVSVEKLCRFNDLVSCDKIIQGQKLQIPQNDTDGMPTPTPTPVSSSVSIDCSKLKETLQQLKDLYDSQLITSDVYTERQNLLLQRCQY